MKKMILWLAMFSFAPQISFGSDDMCFSNKDMWALSRKISHSLNKCKPLRRHAEVVVDVQNDTAEFVDKARFSELIHSMLEGKTQGTDPNVDFPECSSSRS